MFRVPTLAVHAGAQRFLFGSPCSGMSWQISSPQPIRVREAGLLAVNPAGAAQTAILAPQIRRAGDASVRRARSGANAVRPMRRTTGPLRTASAGAARQGTPILARMDAKTSACLSTGGVPARGPGTKLARFSDFRRAGVALSTNLLNSAFRSRALSARERYPRARLPSPPNDPGSCFPVSVNPLSYC